MEQEQNLAAWAKAQSETAARIVRNIGQIGSDATLAQSVLSSRMMASAVEAISKLATTPWQVAETNWGPRITHPDWRMTRGVGTGDAWLELSEIGPEEAEGFSWISIAVGADLTRLGLEFVFRPGLQENAAKAISEDKRITPLLNLGMVRDAPTSRLFFPVNIEAEALAQGFEAKDLTKAIAPVGKATELAIKSKPDLDALLNHVREAAKGK